MGFSYTRIGKRIFGGALIMETYSYASADGSTGGNITTGLNRVVFAKIMEKDSSAMANLAALNTTLPSGKTIAVKTTANKSGWVWVLGK